MAEETSGQLLERLASFTFYPNYQVRAQKKKLRHSARSYTNRGVYLCTRCYLTRRLIENSQYLQNLRSETFFLYSNCLAQRLRAAAPTSTTLMMMLVHFHTHTRAPRDSSVYI